MSALQCWNCGENLDDVPRPISRQANCPTCFNELHCCRLCRHFDAAKNMECFEDRADPPLQKENANFCEFFSPRTGAFEHKTAVKSSTARANLDGLFGAEQESPAQEGEQPSDDAPEPKSKEDLAKKKLDDLFG